jgi:DNA-binding transcriptional MerR regulator
VDEDLLAIGAFARLCRLSVKRLRHYDDMGLLVPAWVDPDSGYRYYRPEQARDAAVIGLLRSLDVSLPTIAEVLSGASVRGVLGDVRDQMEVDLARRVRALQAVERMLAQGMPSAEVSILQRPALDVAVVSDTSTLQRIAATTSACVAALLRAFEAAGVELTGPIVGIFPLDLPDELPVAAAAETGRPIPGTMPDVLPGGSFASATHVGPYEHIGLTAHALLTWCAEHRHVPTGPLREVYASDPRSTPPEQLVTHLMLRLEDPP